MEKKKILLCYFAPQVVDYTPTDLGYLVAILQQEISSEYEFKIIQLTYEATKETGDEMRKIQKDNIRKDVELIIAQKPDAVFLFIESVLWSGVFAIGRADLIMEGLRRRQPELFVGLQSYKINEEKVRKILNENRADCVVQGNPEGVFLQLDEILQKKYVPGVHYCKVMFSSSPTTELKKKYCAITDNLDDIPSPYLGHIFDNHIKNSQALVGDSFRASLVSSRGCSFGCYYCSRSVKFEKVRYFSPKRFYDELEYLFNQFKVYRFMVLDDAFLYSKQRLREFEKEFEKRLMANPGLENVVLYIMARPETIDRENVEILAKINVKYVQIGLQTVNPNLQHYMKRAVDVGYFSLIREWLRKYDINLYIDVIVGLPGDSVEWCKKSVSYALSLDPFFFQIKQLYLNNNTLFQRNQAEYAIEVEERIRDFKTPYVIKAKNIDDEYFEKTNEFIMQKIKANPQIYWRYITNKNNFLSDGVYRDPKRTSARFI